MIDGLKPYPEYKDSGVEWLGTIPESWEAVALGQLGRFFRGAGGTKADELAEGVPCVRYGDLYTQHRFFIAESRSCVSAEDAAQYAKVQYGDVLFAASGETLEEIGRSAVNLIPGEARAGGDILILRPSRPVNARFLGYVCESPGAASQKARMGKGVTVMHIYSGALRNLRLGLPPLPIQAAIVGYLDRIDSRVDGYVAAKERLIGLLEEVKQAVIHRAVTRGLDPNVRLKPSGVDWLGDVPEHWDVIDLGWVADVLPGFAFPSAEFSRRPDDVRLLRGVNVAPGAVRWGETVRWPNDRVQGLERYQLREGDVVLGLDRPMIAGGTRAARVTASDLPALLLQRVARLRARPGASIGFLYLLIRGHGFKSYMAPLFTGISVPHLSPEQVKAFRVPLPPVDEQLAISIHVSNQVEAVENGIQTATRQIGLLREFRTRLISDVVTGKLDVREAAARLPDDPEAGAPVLDEAIDEAVA